MPGLNVYNPYAFLNYLQSLGNPQTTTVPGFNVGCCTPAYNGMYQIALETGSFSQVIENSNAVYLTVASDTSIAGMPLKMNFGLREEFTNLTTIGIGKLPTSLTIQPSDHTAELVAYGPQSMVRARTAISTCCPMWT